MGTRVLLEFDERVVSVTGMPEGGEQHEWVWVDVMVDGDSTELDAVAGSLGLDPLAVRDAVSDRDLPKLDDFGHHLVAILHGLRRDRVETYELNCFVTENTLVTVRTTSSPSLDALWEQVQHRPELLGAGPAELLARLSDVLTRRLVSVVDAFDARVEELVAQALTADPDFLGDVMAVRADVAAIRRVVHPQRETLSLLRLSGSSLLSDDARRRFSDVFDVAARGAAELDAARSALAETMDAYRGAEAREATEVTKVLTIYAAVMLPLTLIAGFFGMNHANLPGTDQSWGWLVVAGSMLFVTAVSMGVFIASGWLRRPSGRRAGATLGRGLVEAARTPVQVAGTVFVVSTMPLRSVAPRMRGDNERQLR